ncbi:MAG: hypothetical protein WDN28_10525 [Chthoniobacter sp.]
MKPVDLSGATRHSERLEVSASFQRRACISTTVRNSTTAECCMTSAGSDSSSSRASSNMPNSQ